MGEPDTLYRLFGVGPDCSDEDLRRAYHKLALKHHPDVIVANSEASDLEMKHLNSAYERLINYRRGGERTQERLCSFSQIDTKAISQIKEAFRVEWECYSADPTDPLLGLRLVHAALRAQRQNSIVRILLDPILIDSAPLMLAFLDSKDASKTVVKWADALQENKQHLDALKIMEDMWLTGTASDHLCDVLRSTHYHWAKYRDPTTGNKPEPEVAVKHLLRLIELNLRDTYLDCIHKSLAEAYHAMGYDTQARNHLAEAYQINPDLGGAVRISRALGYATEETSSRRNTGGTRYRYSHPGNVPSTAQIREWAEKKEWATVLSFADLHDYSPRVLPHARKTLKQIAMSLAACSESTATEALTGLLSSVYWDVRLAAMISLAVTPDENTLEALQALSLDNRDRKMIVCYLQTKLRYTTTDADDLTPEYLYRQIRKASASASLDCGIEESWGKIRALSEILLSRVEPTESLHLDATIMLARASANMGDTANAISVVKPFLVEPNSKGHAQVLQIEELKDWIYNMLMYEYDADEDELYLLGLRIHVKGVFLSNSLTSLVYHLGRLADWFALLGADDTVQWLCELLRTEIPETWQANKLQRGRDVRSVELSQRMKDQITVLDQQLKAKAALKLRRALGDTPSI